MTDEVGSDKRRARKDRQPTLLALPPPASHWRIIMAMKALDFGCRTVVVDVTMLMVLMVVVIMRMIMIMMGMIVGAACPLLLRSRIAKRGSGIAKATHALFDDGQITAVVPDGHGACDDRDRDILNAGDTSNRGVDLGGAGGTIHAANPEFRLCRFSHDPLPCQR
jgi:hypothetical protein